MFEGMDKMKMSEKGIGFFVGYEVFVFWVYLDLVNVLMIGVGFINWSGLFWRFWGCKIRLGDMIIWG